MAWPSSCREDAWHGCWSSVWSLVRHGSKRDSASPAATAAPKSLAVLAFASLGDDKANEVLADGVSDELLDVLARVPGLRVVSRNSAFSFKGKSVPATEMARQLGVGYLVEGSVRRAGDRVRIAAQLTSGTDGAVRWSETFDREFKDVLAAQAAAGA
jgi:TolB-like protein